MINQNREIAKPNINSERLKSVRSNDLPIYESESLIEFVFNENSLNNSPLFQSNGWKEWITGKRCLVKPCRDGSNGVYICYLSDDNSEQFHDGTSASLDGSMGIWMTDTPSYWINGGASQANINAPSPLDHSFRIFHREVDDEENDFATFNKSSVFSGTTFHFVRRSLIGVTKAVLDGNTITSRKRSGDVSTAGQTAVQYQSLALNNGSGFSIISYETHKKIAHLFMAKYGSIDPQSMTEFGNSYGEINYNKVLGTTSSLGNQDGYTSTQKSFLGIEDFIEEKSEYMSGILTEYGTQNRYYVFDGLNSDLSIPSNAIIKTMPINSNGGVNHYGVINYMDFGEYGDIVPILCTATDYQHGYRDYGNIAYTGLTTVRRANRGSGGNQFERAGLFTFYSNQAPNYTDSVVGTRLEYRGEIHVVENALDFISLPL